MKSDDPVRRNRNQSERIVGPQVFLGGERQSAQIPESAYTVRSNAEFSEARTVERAAQCGADTFFQSLQLKRLQRGTLHGLDFGLEIKVIHDKSV